MDSGTGRKRPWEEDSPIESQRKRRSSFTAAAFESVPPLPHHAGPRSCNSQTQGGPTLPPLYTSTFYTGSAGSTPATPLPATLRPRSQSLFDVALQNVVQQSEGNPESTQVGAQNLEGSRFAPIASSEAYRSQRRTDPQPHAGEEAICCPSRCQGQGCLQARALVRSLATELVLLDSKVRYLSQRDYSATSESPDIEKVPIKDSLQWTLDLVQCISLYLQDHANPTDIRSPGQASFEPDTLPAMRRGQQHLEQREEQSPPTRQYVGRHQGFTSFTHQPMPTEQARSNPYTSDQPPNTGSPHHTASSSGSVFLPPQSPMHTPQPTRPGMLPSPSSMTYHGVATLSSVSPPSAAIHSSAQATHLHDLQHQISVKTLAHQTLQREYDNLLQKLERQRTKCATLEKKFEVSDVEINGLTDEKERLNAQVAMLESQVEELRQSRDETRNQLVANGAQYMRIMEMASRLQAQGAEDKKRWEAERIELRQRIKVLEEAMVTGTQRSVTGPEETSELIPIDTETHSVVQTPASSSSTETIKVLRAEIGRLRLRTQGLETALQTMREEGVAIQEAAKKLIDSGGKIEEAALGTMGG